MSISKMPLGLRQEKKPLFMLWTIITNWKYVNMEYAKFSRKTGKRRIDERSKTSRV